MICTQFVLLWTKINALYWIDYVNDSSTFTCFKNCNNFIQLFVLIILQKHFKLIISLKLSHTVYLKTKQKHDNRTKDDVTVQYLVSSVTWSTPSRDAFSTQTNEQRTHSIGHQLTTVAISFTLVREVRESSMLQLSSKNCYDLL